VATQFCRRTAESYVTIFEHTQEFDSRGDTVRRITRAALGGLAGCALVLGGTELASGALSSILKIHDKAHDVHIPTVALDNAKAKIKISESADSTTFSISVTGITGAEPGTELGSHLHTGQCVEGDYGDALAIPGGQAGPHYNHDVVVGGKAFPGPGVLDPARISPETEVWFDLVPDAKGLAYDETTVPFVPEDPDGVMSIVVHVLPTNPATGAAGTRQACFPVSVPQWADG
jgi:Cu/Zn superoxide dismutase